MTDQTTSNGSDTTAQHTAPATPATPATPDTPARDAGDIGAASPGHAPTIGSTGTGSTAGAGFDLNQPTIISLCYLAGWVTGGVSGIVGLVLAIIWQKENREEWAQSHFAYHARTFWFSLAAGVLGVILSFFVIGLFVLMAVPVYVTVRAIMSMLKAQKREPMPDPQTLLF